MTTNHDAARMLAKQQVVADPNERRRTLVNYLAGRLSLDPILVARFLGEPIFSQQFEGQPATEEVHVSLMVANHGDEQVFKFLLYAKVGEELTTGGGAAPACTLRRVS